MNMLTKGIEDKTKDFQKSLGEVIQPPKLAMVFSGGFNKGGSRGGNNINIHIHEPKFFNTDDIDKIMNPVVSRLRSLNIQGRSF